MEDPVTVQVSDFVAGKVLAVSPFTKKIYISGTANKQQAVLVLEKEPFTADDLPDVLQEASPPKVLFKNDIYHSLIHFPKVKHSGIKTILICPATEEIVNKYTPEQNLIVEETEKLYREVTEPFITAKHGPPTWLYNILDHEAETDRVIFEDPDTNTGYILLPDLKWDGTTLEGLYVQALPHNRKLRTIRDLTSEHLPLLRKIALQGPKIIEAKYDIPKHTLLAYLHYLPSFYHLHVHFKLMQQDGNPGTGTERAHLLSTVISNLVICPDYYKRATLPCCLKKSDELLSKLLSNNVVDTNGSEA